MIFLEKLFILRDANRNITRIFRYDINNLRLSYDSRELNEFARFGRKYFTRP